MHDENLMWFPNPELYIPREDEDYTQTVKDLPLERVVELVQTRVTEDGEWAITNGRVGPDNRSEPKMRKMMAFASDEKNIEQALDYIYKEGTADKRTVDYVCRELAKASQWAVSTGKV